MSGRRMWGSMAPPHSGSDQSYVRLGAEMYIKIIYVQSLSHKILIMFWTWPWKLEVNDVPVASTPAAAQREPVADSWGKEEVGRGPLVSPSAQIYISKYSLGIYSLIKEIGWIVQFQVLFSDIVGGCARQMELSLILKGDWKTLLFRTLKKDIQAV